MRFIIELVATTGDTTRFNIAGYLSPDENEEDLMKEMIECLNDVLAQNNDFSEHIRIKEDKIIYNDIPIVTCSNILKILQKNLSIKINTEVCKHTKYIPDDCSALFRMEMNRLFN